MTAVRVRGRPTKLTPGLQEEAVSYLEKGLFPESVAALIGVATSTFYEWVRRGNRESSGQYRDFSEAVKGAIARAEHQRLLVIEKAAERGIWQASAWILERRFPRRWSTQRGLSPSDPNAPVDDDANDAFASEYAARQQAALDQLLNSLG